MFSILTHNFSLLILSDLLKKSLFLYLPRNQPLFLSSHHLKIYSVHPILQSNNKSYLNSKIYLTHFQDTHINSNHLKLYFPYNLNNLLHLSRTHIIPGNPFFIDNINKKNNK
jgi:hypothetical protein